jgi:hypothetical protein
MVKHLWSVLAALAVALPMSARAAEPVAAAFGPGEQSTYRVHYLGVSAGTAKITVGAETTQWGAKVWPIVTLANTDSLLAVYPVRDRFVTYWDMSGGRSVGHELYADEGRKKRRQRVQLDHHGKVAKVMKQKEGEGPSERTYEIEPGTSDVAAATFMLRNQPLAVGRTFDLPVFTGAKSFVMKAHVEGVETLETSIGNREVFKIRVQTAFGGKFESKRDMYAFVTTDATHIPVRIEAEFLLGKLVAELTEYKAGRAVASRTSLAHEG